jgi:hypothetical protein
MRAPLKVTVLLAVMVLASFSLAAGQEPVVWVNMAEVTGLTPEGYIPDEGGNIGIPIRMTNYNEARTAINNGFIFSGNVEFNYLGLKVTTKYPVNQQIAQTYFDCWEVPPEPWMEPCFSWFDFSVDIFYINDTLGICGYLDGVGMGVSCLTAEGSGLPADFDDVIYNLTVYNAHGEKGAKLILDSTSYKPANLWTWSGLGTVAWGGGEEGYLFQVKPDTTACPDGPYTECWPQPTVLGNWENDKILEFYIYCEEPGLVDMASVRVNNIPNYENDGEAWFDAANNRIETTAFIMRFLGASGFRPIPSTGVDDIYTVTYLRDGVETSLTGAFKLNVEQADVNFDGITNLDDVIFLTDYLYRGGQKAMLFGEEMDECMDVDGNGHFDLLDVGAALQIIY